MLDLVAGLPEIPTLAEMFSILFSGETMHISGPFLTHSCFHPSQLVKFKVEWQGKLQAQVDLVFLCMFAEVGGGCFYKNYQGSLRSGAKL